MFTLNQQTNRKTKMCFFTIARPDLAGSFKHQETKKTFEFAPTKDEWALEHGLPFEIAVHWWPERNFTEVRFARILKTVAHVAVDMNDDETPIFEHWPIKHW
jgi:hypothetical protein